MIRRYEIVLASPTDAPAAVARPDRYIRIAVGYTYRLRDTPPEARMAGPVVSIPFRPGSRWPMSFEGFHAQLYGFDAFDRRQIRFNPAIDYYCHPCPWVRSYLARGVGLSFVLSPYLAAHHAELHRECAQPLRPLPPPWVCGCSTPRGYSFNRKRIWAFCHSSAPRSPQLLLIAFQWTRFSDTT